MNSRASLPTAAPSWGALRPAGRGELARRMPWAGGWGEPATRPPAARPIRPRFAGLARPARDVAAGALLAALWIGLWTAFTLGVLAAFADVSTLTRPEASAPTRPERSGVAEPTAPPPGAALPPGPSPRVRR